MALTDTFVRNVKPTGTSVGEKYADGQGLYLHVKSPGKYWRLNYRYAGKQKTKWGRLVHNPQAHRVRGTCMRSLSSGVPGQVGVGVNIGTERTSVISGASAAGKPRIGWSC